jgi:hypothetical protein
MREQGRATCSPVATDVPVVAVWLIDCCFSGETSSESPQQDY